MSRTSIPWSARVRQSDSAATSAGEPAGVRTLGIIMNGVTGRMGTTSTSSARSSRSASRAASRCRTATRLCPSRSSWAANERKLQALARDARHRALDDRPRRGARRPERHRSTSTRRLTRRAPSRRARRSRAGKHVYCEKPIAADLGEALELARLARRGGRQERRRAGQAVPAGPAQAQAARRRAASSAASSRVRGEFGYWVFEGDLAARAAAVVELPQRGRRRHHRRHVLPLALRARQPLRRRCAAVLRARRHAHPRARRRGGQRLRAHRRGRGVRDRSSSTAARSSPDELVVVRARQPRRAARAPGRRHARQRGRGPARVQGAARRRRRRGRSGTRTSRTRSTSATAGRTCPTTAQFENAFKLQWELFLRHVALDEPFPWDFLEGAQGRAARRAGRAVVARAALARRAGARRCERYAECRRLDRCLPLRDGVTRAVHAPARRARDRAPARRSRSASPTRPRTSSPIRCATRRSAPGRRSTGTRRSPTAGTCGRYGLARRRGDGHGAARHGARLGRGAGADPPLGRRGARRGRRASRAAPAPTSSRPAPRSRWTTSSARTRSSARSSRASGGRVILMASRALAARGAVAPTTTARSTARMLRQVTQPVILHWLGDMFDPALAGYWGTRDLDAAMDVVPRRDPRRTRDKVDGIKISLLDADARDRAAAAAARRACGCTPATTSTTRADPRRRARASDALLGIFDAIAPAAAAALQALDARRSASGTRRCSRRRCRCRATSSRAPTHALQDGRRLPRVPERPPGALPHGRRAGERALRACTSPSCSCSPTRPGCCATRSSPCARMRHVLRCRGGRVVTPTTRCALALNSMTVDRWRLDEVIDACAARGVEWIGAVAPQGRPRSGCERGGAADRATRACACRALCRGGFFGAPTRRATRTTGARSRRPRSSAPTSLVLVCGPPATKDLALARADGRGRHRARCSRTRSSTASGSGSSRCTR